MRVQSMQCRPSMADWGGLDVLLRQLQLCLPRQVQPLPVSSPKRRPGRRPSSSLGPWRWRWGPRKG
eukprot:scaffold69221_cov16-Prasinocladus_malaysianus.AAC.2